MANLKICILSICFLLVSEFTESEVISLCNGTPFPDLCIRLVDANLVTRSNMKAGRQGFRNLILHATMIQAEKAYQDLLAMKDFSMNERAKTALADCFYLYEDTVNQINRSITVSDFENTQIWLSAALNNQITCENGFMELNLASYLPILPEISRNISKLIRNSLAINKRTTTTNGRKLLSYDKFPSWLSTSARRLLQSSNIVPNLVVAKDGSGNFQTINEAIRAAKSRNENSRFVIYVKSGVYEEHIDITRSMRNIMLIGDGISSTIISGSKSVSDGSTTYSSATFGVSGDRFIARDITFENTAGPQKFQAVALRSSSDLSVFYRCSFKGYQDTLFVLSGRQFYRDCEIYGTIDFIFGDAAAVFQNCDIKLRRPLRNQKNVITAQGRTDPNENTGISIHDSKVSASNDLIPVQNSVKSYLGRPWQKYSRTVYMLSSLDSLIDPEGWLRWSGGFALSTLYYGEFMNTGPGSDTSNRVNWPGFRVITSATEAEKFTVGSFLNGDSWIPSDIPFTSGL